MRPTATGATNGGEPAPVCQPRCKVCKSPELLQRVNSLLASGFTTTAILNAIGPANAALAPKSRITDDSLHRHRHRHFPVQAGASSVWRRLLEIRAAADAADFERGVLNLVTPRAYLEVMVTKAFAGLAAEGAEIAPELGLRAAGELGKLTARDDDEAKWAKVHSQQQRIIEVMKSLAPALQDEVLAKLDGRPWPPPGGTRLALVDAAPAGDDVFDRFDETDFADDDDD